MSAETSASVLGTAGAGVIGGRLVGGVGREASRDLIPAERDSWVTADILAKVWRGEVI